MSFFSKVFGGKKEPTAPSTAEAIQKLRETEEMLMKKQDFLEKKIDIEKQTARKNGTANKRGYYHHDIIIPHTDGHVRSVFRATTLTVSHVISAVIVTVPPLTRTLQTKFRHSNDSSNFSFSNTIESRWHQYFHDLQSIFSRHSGTQEEEAL